MYRIQALIFLATHVWMCGALSIRHASNAAAGPARPLISTDFPDPAIAQSPDGTWYAFATTDGTKANVQMATSPDFKTWTVQDADALPHPGDWVDGYKPEGAYGAVWAPDVRRMHDGTYLMYYSAAHKQNPALHCIGVATSSVIAGPYTPVNLAPTDVICPIAQGGAIDASTYIDKSTGKMHVTYKIDGNAIKYTDPATGQLSTPIMLQEVEPANGYKHIGAPVKIFDRDDSSSNLVEAPVLVKGRHGKTVLFYSTGGYNTDAYDTRFAIAPPGQLATLNYRKSGHPLLRSDVTTGLKGPGGASLDASGRKMVFHGILSYEPLVRGMFAAEVDYHKGQPKIFRYY